MLPFPSTETEFVTVICLRVEPRYEEVVMSRSEFKKFNKVFKVEEEGFFEDELLKNFKFKDWNTDNLDMDIDSNRYYFRAYTGDATSGSDDLVDMDYDQSWQEAFDNKPLKIRKFITNTTQLNV